MSTLTDEKIEKLIPRLYEQDARAMILVGREGQVLRANPAALRLMDATGALRMDRGRIVAALPSLTAELHRKIGLALDEPVISLEQAGSLAMALVSPDQGHPLAASVTPLHADHPLVRDLEVSAAALWLDDPLADVEPCTEVLRTWFGLTPAEARVAIELTNGLSPKEIAAKRGRHIRTIRTQVESVFSKLGVTRTAQLVKVITRVAGIVKTTIAGWMLGVLHHVEPEHMDLVMEVLV